VQGNGNFHDPLRSGVGVANQRMDSATRLASAVGSSPRVRFVAEFNRVNVLLAVCSG